MEFTETPGLENQDCPSFSLNQSYPRRINIVLVFSFSNWIIYIQEIFEKVQLIEFCKCITPVATIPIKIQNISITPTWFPLPLLSANTHPTSLAGANTILISVITRWVLLALELHINGIIQYYFMPGFFHPKECFQDLFLVLCAVKIASILFLNSIPL